MGSISSELGRESMWKCNTNIYKGMNYRFVMRYSIVYISLDYGAYLHRRFDTNYFRTSP